MSLMKEFTKGFVKENPVFIMALGLCPTLAVSSSVQNAIGMGFAATFVLIFSNILCNISISFCSFSGGSTFLTIIIAHTI